jgi:hypothetical protein
MKLFAIRFNEIDMAAGTVECYVVIQSAINADSIRQEFLAKNEGVDENLKNQFRWHLLSVRELPAFNVRLKLTPEDLPLKQDELDQEVEDDLLRHEFPEFNRIYDQRAKRESKMTLEDLLETSESRRNMNRAEIEQAVQSERDRSLNS